jgi:hypothetical protein
VGRVAERDHATGAAPALPVEQDSERRVLHAAHGARAEEHVRTMGGAIDSEHELPPDVAAVEASRRPANEATAVGLFLQGVAPILGKLSNELVVHGALLRAFDTSSVPTIVRF